MNKKIQIGQAMTETLITASTVLVPLLLLIPLLGKYIDIKHATIQAARYEAWEYTVWYSNNAMRTGPWSSGERSSGFQDLGGSNLPQPIKSVTELQQESRQRFFSQTDAPITSADKSGWDDGNARQLWRDHRGNRLWDGDIPSGTATKSSENTPDYSGGVLNILLDVLDAVFGAIAYAMQLVGSDVGFTAINTDGLSKSDLMVPVSAPVGLIDFATITDTTRGVDDSTTAYDLEFEAGAAVLTDGWNAGGTMHTTNQVGGITPTKILDSLVDTLLDSVPGLDVAWAVATVLIPEWRFCDPAFGHFLDESPGETDEHFLEYQNDGSLWLGYINIDAVHPDRLDIGGSHDCPDGICNFSYQNYSPCN